MLRVGWRVSDETSRPLEPFELMFISCRHDGDVVGLDALTSKPTPLGAGDHVGQCRMGRRHARPMLPTQCHERAYPRARSLNAAVGAMRLASAAPTSNQADCCRRAAQAPDIWCAHD